MRPTLLLFDIDGTLLLTGGAGRRAMSAAFADRFQRPDACTGFSFGGMTDPAIVRRSLHNIAVAAEESAIQELIDGYLGHLQVELGRSEATVLPGVWSLLERLERQAHLALGIGTGNVERGAQLKLETAGLRGRFSFGGFGSDAEERSELLRSGARRGAERMGLPLERCRVIVLGDTPRDIEAAHAIGAECVAVATGPFEQAQLEPLAPALCCASLEDPRIFPFLEG